MTKCLEKISNLLLRHTYKLWKMLFNQKIADSKIRTFSVYTQIEGFFVVCLSEKIKTGYQLIYRGIFWYINSKCNE